MEKGQLIEMGASSPLFALLQLLSPLLAVHGPCTVLPAWQLCGVAATYTQAAL